MATISAKQVLDGAVATMEESLALDRKQARDFAESFVAFVEEQIEQGNAVNLFGLVKLTPKFKAATKAQKNVPSPFSPGETMDRAAKPASITVKALALKRAKDAAPSVNSKAGRSLKA